MFWDIERRNNKEQVGIRSVLAICLAARVRHDSIRFLYLKLNKKYWLYLVLLVYYMHTHTTI